MNKQEINQIIEELEQRGYTVQYNPPPKQQHYGGGGNGLIFLFAIGIMVFGVWAIMNQQTTPIQGYEPTNSYVITESTAVILATSTQMAYPTNTPFPTTPAVNPVLGAIKEWTRPITPDQYNQCLANHNVNPACEDYLRANGVIP